LPLILASPEAPEVEPRPRPSSKPALDLPPPFRLVTLREVGDAFAHAVRVAGEEGAGTLVHVGRFDLAELAVVLEPQEPLRSARRALYAGLCALGDALAAHAA
jgi:Biotin/lipoate A/B protein ligase family